MGDSLKIKIRLNNITANYQVVVDRFKNVEIEGRILYHWNIIEITENIFDCVLAKEKLATISRPEIKK